MEWLAATESSERTAKMGVRWVNPAISGCGSSACSIAKCGVS